MPRYEKKNTYELLAEKNFVDQCNKRSVLYDLLMQRLISGSRIQHFFGTILYKNFVRKVFLALIANDGCVKLL